MAETYKNNDEAIAGTYQKTHEEKIIEATDGLVWYVDRLLSASKFEDVKYILAELQFSLLNHATLTGLCTLVSHARDRGHLVEEYNDFFANVLNNFSTERGFPAERIEKLKQRLG